MPVTAKIEHLPTGAKLPDLTKAGADSNGPDRDEFLFMVGQLAKADADVKAARDARKKLRQHFSNRGVNLAMMDAAIEEADKEDGTTLSNLRDMKRYFEFLGLPIGYQFSFLDQPPAAANGNAGSDEARAFAEGRERGIRGLNPDEDKWLPVTPEGQAHLAGWNEGQAVNLAKFRDLHDGMTMAEKQAAADKAAKDKKKAERAAKAVKKGEAALAEASVN